MLLGRSVATCHHLVFAGSHQSDLAAAVAAEQRATEESRRGNLVSASLPTSQGARPPHLGELSLGHAPQFDARER